MDLPFFSIIVPVYNVEKYIVGCLESILSQTFYDFEILIIDDGSIDKSIQLIKEHFFDERIQIFHKENGGLSDARNFGLNLAKGGYVWFIDSDDTIKSKYALSKISEIITLYENKIEIVVFNMEVVFENNIRDSYIVENVVEDTSVLSGYNYIELYNIFPFNAPTQCYKRMFLIENGFNFPLGLYFEDIYCNLDIYKKVKSIIGIDDVFYTYFRRGNSITSQNTNIRHYLSQVKVLNKMYNYYFHEILPRNYFKERLQVEFERIKLFFDKSFKLEIEDQKLLKKIKIPFVKDENFVQKIEKYLFYYFPFFVLENQKLFRKTNTFERIIKRKIT